MSTLETVLAKRGRTLVGAMVVVVVGLLRPDHAQAHFILDAPPNWMSQVPNDGSPQKLGPCGDEGGGTATNMVTSVIPQADGSYRVTVMWHDTVPHAGHYRIAFANSRSELPLEPTVTPSATDQCASAVTASAPFTLPILMDNINPQATNTLRGNQMVTVTIPAGASCPRCALQVLEFMSLHGAPCFYHHCAELSLGAATGAGGAGGRAGGAGGAGGTAGRAGGAGGGAGGRGGATGAGGTTAGTGGSTVGSGGATGTGGTVAGSGGATGTGGTTTGSGGATGTGGSATGSGGATAGGKDAAADAASPGSSGGCGCSLSLVRGPVRGMPLVLLLSLGLAALLRRRRR